MFDFWGDGLFVKNLTMGNYCNVDLEYPLNPLLNRPKRMSAITQAHVAYAHGDKIVAENVRFISRLNMNPLNGAKRILFNDCHLECTDDALTGTGVYLNCSFGFYAPRPFWRTDMGGAVFLNCDFELRHNNGRQYFCKSVGPVSVIDSRFHSYKPCYLGWTHQPTDWLRCYQANVTQNGEPYRIGSEKSINTICLDSLPQLNAYRIIYQGDTLYNTYNLLRGEDDWDPLGVKPQIVAAGVLAKADYTQMATCLSVAPLTVTIQTGQSPLRLTAQLKRHVNYVLNNLPIKWKVADGYESDVRLSTDEGFTCEVTAMNQSDETKHFTVIAYTDEGHECATELTVIPDFVTPPAFIDVPRLVLTDGLASLQYTLDLEGRHDESPITWYRCTDEDGVHAIPVAVSRLNEPLREYRLTKDDVGYYLKAVISPKHLRCHAGEPYSVTTSSLIKKEDVAHDRSLVTDFKHFPTCSQPLIIPGFWTVGGYKPHDTREFDLDILPDKEYWFYGYGRNGAKGTGLVQGQRGARILYTPLAAY